MTNRAQKGFFLLSAMIALILISLGLAVAIQYTKEASRQKASEQLIGNMAREHALIFDALGSYIPDQQDTWTANTPVNISVPALVGAGLLPTRFGNYDNVSGVGFYTPKFSDGSAIVIRAQIDNDDVPTAVISSNNTYSKAALGKSGFVTTTVAQKHQATRGFSTRVKTLLGEQYQVVGGILTENTDTASQLPGGATKIITAYISGTADHTRPVSFWGFEDLYPGGSGGGPGNNNDTQYESCQISTPNVQYNIAPGSGGRWFVTTPHTCPASTVQLRSFPACQTSGFIALPEAGTSITFGTRDLVPLAIGDGSPSCDTNPVTGDPNCTGKQDEATWVQVFIGNALQDEVLCDYDLWYNRFPTNSATFSQSGVFGGRLTRYSGEGVQLTGTTASETLVCCVPLNP